MKKFLSSLVLSILVVGLLYLLGSYMYKLSFEKVNDMYMEVTILDNGDVEVKKVVSYGNKKNDISIINKKYKNEFESGNLDSYSSSKIYNYDNSKIIEISKVSEFGKNIEVLEKSNLSYKRNNSKYVVDSDLIYMSYILTNYAVLHNDLGELLFSITEDEKIENLEVVINIPNNSSKLEYYLHGASHTNIENIDNTKVRITGEKLTKDDYLDVRLIFDREVIKNSPKTTNVDASSSIISIEKEIDKKYKEEQKINSYKGVIGIILDVIKTIWLAVTIFMLMRTYLKYDKEYKRRFKKEVLNKKPGNLEPYEIEFLNYGNITQNSIKSAILKMISEGKLSLKKMEDSYLIKKSKKVLTEEEEYLVNLFFKSGIIDVKDLKTKDYESFSEYTYDKLINKYLLNSISKNYYEDETDVKKMLVLYSLLGIFLNIISYLVIYNEMIMISIYLVAITTMFYFLSFRKKTKKGNEEYAKWEAYKKYLVSNELAENDYQDALIYGSVLGIKNRVLDNCIMDNDFVEFSEILLNLNILRK